MPKFLANLDLNKNELQNSVLQVLAANPGSPSVGQFYFNSSSNKIRSYNGSTWDEYGTSTASGTVTSINVASANGFAGTSDGNTTSPTLTISTTITGVLKGNGTAISAATGGTDFVVGGTTTVGKIITQAATAAGASLLLTPQTGTPSAPASGDLWNNAGIIKFYNGSATKDIAFTDSNITGSAGSVAQALSISAELISGGASSYNGSVAKSIAIQATSVTNAMLAGSIAASKLVGTDIATVGTITAGTWNATVIGSAYGGAGTVNGILKANGSGTVSAATAGTDYVTESSTNTFTNKTFDANGTGNSISNLETADFAANVIDVDGTLAANSDTRIASQKAVKTYVDTTVTSIKWKQSVRAATTTAGTLATSFENGDVIDGVTLATGDRILIKDQSAGAENGIYTVNASGAPTRATDADTAAEIKGAVVTVQEGTSNGDTAWQLITDTITLGTTALVFTNFITANVPSASTTVQGKVELATQAEAQTKSDSTLAVTPASLADFARKYTGTIGNGSSTSIAVTHGLGSQYVTAQAFDASTGDLLFCDITLTSSTQTTFSFATAPASNAIRVVITG